MSIQNSYFGKGTIEFDENSYLLTILEKNSFGNNEYLKIDLSALRDYFTTRFIQSIQEYLIFRAGKGISASSLRSEGYHLTNFLKKVISSGILKKTAYIDFISSTLLSITCTIEEKFTQREYEILALIWNSGFSGLFSKEVSKTSFPKKRNPRGLLGQRLNNILELALPNDAIARIMTYLESCYEDQKITLGQWAFFNLLLNTRVRIGSIRLMTVQDIVHDESKDEYYAYILPEKQNVDNPQKSPFRLTRSVGRIIRKQRLEILKLKNAESVSLDQQHNMALFPLLTEVLPWSSENNYGRHPNVGTFAYVYQTPINRLLGGKTINSRVLRHSVGTHLASMGMSSKTIQSVLRHVGTRTCQAYIEIHLNGNIDLLSDALEPAFDKYFPVFKEFASIKNQENKKNVIKSDNLDTGETLEEGVCGSEMRCFSAPFSCYSCNRFIPFYDVDHEINLKIIDSKIEKFQGQGLAFQDAIQTLKRTKSYISLVNQACIDFERQSNERD